jgi:tRNA threonylcarbamoyladenosine biosynthesis protein TsaE
MSLSWVFAMPKLLNPNSEAQVRSVLGNLCNSNVMTNSTDSQEQPAQLLINVAQTDALGRVLARVLQQQPPSAYRIYLQGPLGAGKTTLTRALLQALGVEGRVKSPSYALVEQYSVALGNLAHFDFYRMNDPLEWEEAGFSELFVDSALVIAEWPEKAQGMLPPADLLIHWEFGADPQDNPDLPRTISFECGSPTGIALADAAYALLGEHR